jgi:hypothetical protein
MKALLVLLTLGFVPTLSAANVHGYSGHWTLDRAQSKDLAPWYSRIKSHELDISQTDAKLDVIVTITSDQPAPERFEFHYLLDGTETHTETSIRTPEGLLSVPTTLRAATQHDGSLYITISRDLPFGDGAKGVTVETWTLKPGEGTLLIHRADDSPMGKRESDLVFVQK